MYKTIVTAHIESAYPKEHKDYVISGYGTQMEPNEAEKLIQFLLAIIKLNGGEGKLIKTRLVIVSKEDRGNWNTTSVYELQKLVFNKEHEPICEKWLKDTIEIWNNIKDKQMNEDSARRII